MGVRLQAACTLFHIIGDQVDARHQPTLLASDFRAVETRAYLPRKVGFSESQRTRLRLEPEVELVLARRVAR